ncbi:hypothetical protein [Noviherbaspirillum aerium]|uniref:hypothetical protein n=1 Tax=Noviherbaspirillum aerium TaxID=2588497 RepID=UPI00124C3634|nr:hypothetical protein [Noviherbaspirillum aerium]
MARSTVVQHLNTSHTAEGAGSALHLMRLARPTSGSTTIMHKKSGLSGMETTLLQSDPLVANRN